MWGCGPHDPGDPFLKKKSVNGKEVGEGAGIQIPAGPFNPFLRKKSVDGKEKVLEGVLSFGAAFLFFSRKKRCYERFIKATILSFNYGC